MFSQATRPQDLEPDENEGRCPQPDRCAVSTVGMRRRALPKDAIMLRLRLGHHGTRISLPPNSTLHASTFTSGQPLVSYTPIESKALLLCRAMRRCQREDTGQANERLG